MTSMVKAIQEQQSLKEAQQNQIEELKKMMESFIQIQTLYTLVVFGACWCPKCTEELPTLIQNYSKWKNLGIEVVYVSLDTDSAVFNLA
jgi:thiol-disulfide isomerase/thioredoxin